MKMVCRAARAAGVDRSFLYRHHDLRARIHARAATTGTSPASTTATRQSLIADLANLKEHNQRLRHQNTSLTIRLSEVLGEEIFHASGIGRAEDAGQLRARVGELEQQLLDLYETEQLAMADAARVDLVNLALIHEHNAENVTGCHGCAGGACYFDADSLYVRAAPDGAVCRALVPAREFGANGRDAS